MLGYLVEAKVAAIAGAVRAMGALEGLLPRVGPDVHPEVVLPPRPVVAELTGEGLGRLPPVERLGGEGMSLGQLYV